MARTLQEILDDLNNAEKEYAEKCKKYGIEEKKRKKKEDVQLDENGNPIIAEETIQETDSSLIEKTKDIENQDENLSENVTDSDN